MVVVPVEARTNQVNYNLGHIQGFDVAHLNICPINELLEHVKGLVLWNDSLRSNIRISEGIFVGGPVMANIWTM